MIIWPEPALPHCDSPRLRNDHAERRQNPFCSSTRSEYSKRYQTSPHKMAVCCAQILSHCRRQLRFADSRLHDDNLEPVAHVFCSIKNVGKQFGCSSDKNASVAPLANPFFEPTQIR